MCVDFDLKFPLEKYYESVLAFSGHLGSDNFTVKYN